MTRNITVYRVRAGTLTRHYATSYHAEQMARALELHGLSVTVDTVRLPDDPLTRIVVSPAPSNFYAADGNQLYRDGSIL